MDYCARSVSVPVAEGRRAPHLFGMRYALAVVVCLIPLSATAGQRQQAIEKQNAQRWIDAYYKTDDLCRGSYPEEVISQTCSLRDKASLYLRKRGYCFGRDGLSRAEYALWHPCDDD